MTGRAIADYDQALRLDSQFLSAYLDRGFIHQKEDQDDRAIADYSEALRLNPKLAGAYFGRGLVYAKIGDADRAAADFSAAIQINSAYTAAHTGLGLAYELAGDFAHALVSFNTALALPLKFANAQWAQDTALAHMTALVEKASAAAPAAAAQIPANANPPSAATAAPPAATPPAGNANATARRDYELAAQVGTAGAWNAFLKQYPDCFYAELARAQLAKIGGADRPALAKPGNDKPPGEASPVKKAELTPPADNPGAASVHAPTGRELIEEIKKELARLGCYSGPIDGNWGTAGSSVKKFVRTSHAAAAPDEPTSDFLDTLRQKSGRVCPLECGAREVESDGHCVAKTCKDGFELDEDGDCVREKARKGEDRHSRETDEERESGESRHRRSSEHAETRSAPAASAKAGCVVPDRLSYESQSGSAASLCH